MGYNIYIFDCWMRPVHAICYSNFSSGVWGLQLSQVSFDWTCREVRRNIHKGMSDDLKKCLWGTVAGSSYWITVVLVLQARRIIAVLSQDFIFDGCTILVHGFSRVVLEVLKTAAQSKKLFRVFCTGFLLYHAVKFVGENYKLEISSWCLAYGIFSLCFFYIVLHLLCCTT